MPGDSFRNLPYCGAPPAPGHLWLRWNLDPILIFALLAALVLYGVGVKRTSVSTWRRSAFLTGWAVASLALVSPLCALSVSLFSARVAQHMVLSLVAAPLVLLGQPGTVWTAIFPGVARQLRANRIVALLCGPTASAVCFTAAIWFWHAPGPYDATFASPFIYWLMHLSVFGAALLVWNVLLDARRSQTVPVLAVGAVSTLQMTVLGALITMAQALLYAPHVLTTYAWGLTPQADQQLGGLIMWVPGCTVFLAVTLSTLARTMRDPAPPLAAA